MRVFSSVDELASSIGETFGPGPGLLVDQARIQAFADATDDHQWIHLDAQRAAAGPFGGTVAHGFLTLSLLPVLTRDLYRCEGVGMVVNYGLNRVRFPSPLRSGATVHAGAQLISAEPGGGGLQVVMVVTIQAANADKPCCVAESVSRLYRSGGSA